MVLLFGLGMGSLIHSDTIAMGTGVVRSGALNELFSIAVCQMLANTHTPTE